MTTINYGYNTPTAVAWSACSDGVTIGAVVNDGDYASAFGWLSDEVHPGTIINLGSSVSRYITLRMNVYDAGYGNWTLFYRSSDTSFNPTDPVGVGPAWIEYVGGFTSSHRYFDWKVVAGGIPG